MSYCPHCRRDIPDALCVSPLDTSGCILREPLAMCMPSQLRPGDAWPLAEDDDDDDGVPAEPVIAGGGEHG